MLLKLLRWLARKIAAPGRAIERQIAVTKDDVIKAGNDFVAKKEFIERIKFLEDEEKRHAANTAKTKFLEELKRYSES